MYGCADPDVLFIVCLVCGSQVHGFPKVMGVLTHLDAFTDASRLRKVKKKLKARFWTEIYDGAKLFYLSGVQHGRWRFLTRGLL